jgi:choice-of-anchor B domain-containing protein
MKKIFILLCLLSTRLFPQASLNVTFQANLPYPGLECANICGYVDSTGKEYALVGVETGMTVVDVSNPSAPVQLYQVPWPVNNQSSPWKEIKVYKKHAYVVSEAGSGLQICDLSKLPSTTPPTPVYWQPNIGGTTLSTIHALHIDTTKGNIYLFGSNVSNKGAIIASLANPVAPVYLGKFDNTYVHDGYVDNDTLYACEIYDGFLEVIDCSNKTSPQVLATVQTLLSFTHNAWLSPDKKTVFTTDEKTKSRLTSYDISNLANITLLDTVRSLSSSSIVHNTHIRSDNFAVTSWYKDGFNIVDVSRPNNMVVTGYYDSYSAGSGNGFSGAWGVYPFLPSGTIVVSNIGEGLFVFSPNYVRACYLEGNVKDSVTLLNLQNVSVQIVGNTNSLTGSDVAGDYATGLATAGTYTVQFSKSGYQTRIITGVTLANGVLTTLNTKLAPLGLGVPPVLNDETFLSGPNVFEGSTTLKYYLSNSDAQDAAMKVYDYSGNLVSARRLTDMMGEVTLGEGWAKGVYLVTLSTGKPFRIIKAN